MSLELCNFKVCTLAVGSSLITFYIYNSFIYHQITWLFCILILIDINGVKPDKIFGLLNLISFNL